MELVKFELTNPREVLLLDGSWRSELVALIYMNFIIANYIFSTAACSCI